MSNPISKHPVFFGGIAASFTGLVLGGIAVGQSKSINPVDKDTIARVTLAGLGTIGLVATAQIPDAHFTSNWNAQHGKNASFFDAFIDSCSKSARSALLLASLTAATILAYDLSTRDERLAMEAVKTILGRIHSL